MAEHLSEGCSLKATSRLAKVDVSVVQRLKRKVGEHGEAFHNERAQGLRVKALQGDERHGYAHGKGQPQWEAELIDPESKLILSHVQGRRDETLIRRLLEDGASRLANRHELVLLTDGDVQLILSAGAVPVIPPRANRTTLREYDDYLYQERHVVECFINKIKHYRRIFSRFDKLASHYLGFLHFVAALLWLR